MVHLSAYVVTSACAVYRCDGQNGLPHVHPQHVPEPDVAVNVADHPEPDIAVNVADRPEPDVAINVADRPEPDVL